jgi:hypothetical protein
MFASTLKHMAMVNLAQLTEQDFALMADQIEQTSSNESEENLFKTLGNALHDGGYKVCSGTNYEIIEPKMFDQNTEKFNMMKSMKFVQDTSALSAYDAEKEGKKFFKRFKEKANAIICSEPKIKELINGEGTLKEYLMIGIPIVLAALSIAALNPLALTIIATIFAMIIKIGFAAYCDLPTA